MFFLAVWAAVLVGLAFVALAYWRRGLTIVAVAAIAASVVRLVLPTRRVGWLAVRGRVIDVAFYGAFGAGILALAISIVG